MDVEVVVGVVDWVVVDVDVVHEEVAEEIDVGLDVVKLLIEVTKNISNADIYDSNQLTFKF